MQCKCRDCKVKRLIEAVELSLLTQREDAGTRRVRAALKALAVPAR